MLKLLPLILENEVEKEEDLGKAHVLSERGYEFLKSKIDDMNKKASKWGVPPMELKIIKEEFVKKTIPVNLAGRKTVWDDPEAQSKEITVKQYQVEIVGEPPRVEGYEFIAKIQHTPEGNILNYAPKASDQTLPREYRTATQQCDVCKTTRDRNNTFILKLDKDDPQRFPDKKAGDFIMVGSGCLKRFLPNISANALMGYAEMIELIRSSIHEAGGMDDDFMGGYGMGGAGNWMGQSTLAFWLAAVYLHTGKYISKKKAEEFQTSSTLDQAFNSMNPPRGSKDEIYDKVRTDEIFSKKVGDLRDEFIQWTKTKDFETPQRENPTYADFYHNMSIISKQETFKTRNSGLFGALFQIFLRDKGELEKQAQLKAAKPNIGYLGQPGQKMKATVTVKKVKEFEGNYGTQLIVNMEATSNEKDPATGQEIKKEGNLLYFTNTNFELEENEQAEVEFTVKQHQENKFTKLPETQITRMKVLKFITHPEKNAGKEKVKKMSGVVKINGLHEQHGKYDQTTGTYDKVYGVTFAYSPDHHPDMVSTGTLWGIKFWAALPDESSFNAMKAYEGKLVEATWALERAMTVDKLKSSYTTFNTVNFQIVKVVGDVPKSG